MTTDIEVIADVIAAAVRTAIAPVLAKCAELETQVKALEGRAPVPGPQGPQGERGERGEAGPKGEDGAAGTPGEPGREGVHGKDAPAVDIEAIVARVQALIPTPKDGRDGIDGKDGLNGKDAPAVDLETVAHLAAALVPAGKDGAAGRDGQPGVPGVPGRDGTPGERGEKGVDGKDGAPGRDGTLDALRVEQIDERRWRFVRSDGSPMPGDPIYMPVTVYKGVFVDETAYDKGDAVTFGGSLWIARETTKNKPGDGSTAWQLAAKEGRRGRDGAPGKDGERGPKGERGDPGRNFS